MVCVILHLCIVAIFMPKENYSNCAPQVRPRGKEGGERERDILVHNGERAHLQIFH